MSEIPYNIEEIKKFVKEEWHNASERDWQFCILIRGNLLHKYSRFVPEHISFAEFYELGEYKYC